MSGRRVPALHAREPLVLANALGHASGAALAAAGHRRRTTAWGGGGGPQAGRGRGDPGTRRARWTRALVRLPCW